MSVRDRAGERRTRTVRRRELALLSLLYFAQGMPFGFQTLALPLFLRERGVSLEAIGFASVLGLPWLLRPLAGPFVDRFGLGRLGRRKTWIIPAQVGLALSCVAAALVSTRELGVLLALVLLMNVFAAMQDVAVDGLAVDLLGAEDLGAGNTAQVGGYKVGMLVAGGLLVWLAGQLGLPFLFGAMALLVIVVLVVVSLFDEPAAAARLERSGAAPPPASLGATFRLALELFTRPGAPWLILFILTYKLGETIGDKMFRLYVQDAGFSPAQLGLWLSTYGMIASTAGSLLGGLAAMRLPLLRAVALTATLRLPPLFLRWIMAAGLVPTDATWVVGLNCAEELLGGALTTTMFAYMMSRVDRRVGATHFNLLATVEVAGKVPASVLSGVLAGVLGYPGLFMTGALLSVAFLGLVWPVARSTPREPTPATSA